MHLSSDTIWEILKHIRYKDISQVCRTNRQFLEVCRTHQAQTLFRLLQHKYQVDKFLNDMYASRVELYSLHGMISYWQQIGKIPKYSSQDYQTLETEIRKGRDNKADQEFLLQNYHLLPDYYKGLNDIKETDAKFDKAFAEIKRRRQLS